MQPSIKEQVSALVSGKQFELVCNALNKNILEPQDYKKVINISKSELYTYLKDNCSVEDLMLTAPSTKDGFYAIKKNNGWLTYRQEREVHFDKKLINSKEDIWRQYIKVELGYD